MPRFLAVVAFVGMLASLLQAADPPGNLNDLSLEVSALHTLLPLELTKEQLQALLALSKTTADRRKRETARGSAALHKVLAELREALLKGDEKRVDALSEKLEKLDAKGAAELDDDVTITEQASLRVRAILDGLTPKQAAGYIGHFQDDWKGPAERIRETLKTGRTLKDAEWRALRDETANEVGWLLAGSDASASAEVRTRATTLLNRAHKAAGKDFKGEKPDVEKAVARLAGRVGPVQMLQNALERDLAELLSNPRMSHVVQAVLEARKMKR